ncbi:beta strand repeat-containing protein [Massilia endophytica]|uniref:beta strand repeat-containing protein n=1 Tax=Massilia endophytica TaxID=2899220 RepID=UPI001E50557D|nr:Ig-like domain-containing protein [Massilia endophytica]UGQ46778.1 Ig-like domain-containing protein [Massilia endophytica]
MTTANQLFRKLGGWLGAFACAGLLAACGGGGGSAGTGPGGVTPAPKVASVLLTASAASMPSSGLDGTEVTLTAVVKDSGNNVLPNQTVSFTADSGNVSNTTRVTDANGVVTEKLSTKGNATPRTITVRASAGGVNSNDIKVNVVAGSQSLTLTTDSGTLQSSGAAGSEVTVTALVKDSNNTVMPNVKVTLSADSGSLTAGTRITDATGRVTEKLSTGNDARSRTIKVTAAIAGVEPVTTLVSVVGTQLQINASSAVSVGTSTDVTVKLVDSAGNPLNGKAVTYSATRNQLSVKGGGAAVTNSAGQLTLSYAAASAGSDTVTVSAMGETASAAISVSNANFTVAVVNGSGVAQPLATINQCHPVAIHSDVGGTPLGGTVSVSSSRGTVYSDASCASPLTVALPLVSGNATAYVMATSPGLATLTATTTANNATAQGQVEFVAALSATATISVQADPSVVGANAAGSTSQQAAIRAVVRDGTPANNLVKNAPVAFTIVSDPTGGTLTQPAVVITGSDGSATVSYIAGTSSSAVNGVQIRAQIQGGSNASAVASLTVGQKALFISAGTGNTVATPDTTTYRVDYTVLVTDAAGNAKSGVNVTASVRPRTYSKGIFVYADPDGPWVQQPTATCLNEDLDGNGILGPSEDVNGNGRLDPGIPVTVTSTGTTDASGRAIVSLTYARDRAYWVAVDLTITGQTAGTEARYVGYSVLPGLGADYTSKNTTPPGVRSPYGILAGCSNAD